MLLGNLLPTIKIGTANASQGDYTPLKWAVIIMGGYNYYRDLTYNAIQRAEKIMQGRGVPYDLFRDDDIAAPSDNPPLGKHSLQYANGTLKYQVLVLLFDYEPTDDSGINQNYIYWAVGNGTNAVLFNRVARAVPALLRLVPSDVRWDWSVLTTSHEVYETFNDENKEYAAGSTVTLGVTLQYHAIIQKHDEMTVWFNKTWSSTWSLGMANTTYGAGQVWYLGYCLNEHRMDSAATKYPVMWTDRKMEFWGHSINFALNSAERISAGIMPYKRWKGAWIIRLDTDVYYWKNALLPPESVLQAGWVYDYQYCTLGYARTTGTADLSLTSGAPSGYVGLPSSKVKHTDVSGVLQTDLINTKTYKAIVYNKTSGGNYNRIKIDFNENKDFADDIEYAVWENITYPTVHGKLYWNRIAPDFVNPQSINIGWWLTPMLMQSEATNLPKWMQYGAEYGLSYSFHGWQHVAIDGSSTYPMWNGTQFTLNTTYIAEKFEASRYWMAEKFTGTGYGFEENQVVISHPFDAHPAETDSVIDSLPWVLFSYPGQLEYIGFGKNSATSKYTLSSSRQENFYEPSAFAAIEDIVKTLYPVISTYTHALGYNTSFSFPPYSNSIKPANPREAFTFWVNAKDMLESVPTAYYESDKMILEFSANSDLTDFVWKFPKDLNGKQFHSFSDNRSIGQVKHDDGEYIYIEFSQGQGGQRVEVNYGPPPNAVSVTVAGESPPGSGSTSPPTGIYSIAENKNFSITATPSSGYALDHWQVDGANAGSSNPYSFNVTTSNHTVSVFFTPVPMVTVTANDASPLGSGTTNPTAGQYQVAEHSIFQVSAAASDGYVFDHWELDSVNAGSANPYLFNVSTSSHLISPHFAQVTSVQVENCDSLVGWRSSSTPTVVFGIDSTDFQEGTGCVVATTTSPPDWNSYACLEKRMNFSGYSALQMWIKVSDSTKDLRLMVATDWGNYNVYRITGLASDTWCLVSINLTTPITKTGTISFGSIAFIRFEYEVRKTSASFKIDDIRKAP